MPTVYVPYSSDGYLVKLEKFDKATAQEYADMLGGAWKRFKVPPFDYYPRVPRVLDKEEVLKMAARKKVRKKTAKKKTRKKATRKKATRKKATRKKAKKKTTKRKATRKKTTHRRTTKKTVRRARDKELGL